MSRALTVLHSEMSSDACREMVSTASQNPNETIGYSLSSQVEVIDGGDCFELRHKLDPATFKGTISDANDRNGSLIAGQIEVAAQRPYQFLVAFVSLIGLLVFVSSGWDLVFGTHLLYTRSRTELGPGHWSTPEEHWMVFVLLPLVVIPILAALWPKARGVSEETRQTFDDCLAKLFGDIS